MAAVAVATKHLTVTFGGVRAVNDVSFLVPNGQRRIVIGPNGAGKTTLFNAIAGQVRPASGTVELFSRDMTGRPVHARARAGMSRTFQITNLLDGMTVMRNVELAVAGGLPVRHSFLRSLSNDRDVQNRSRQLLEEWDLSDVRDQPVAQLSYGRKRTLEIVMCLAGSPKILLLDEPTAGLSVAEAELVTRIVRKLPRSMTILMIEHDIAVAFDIADEVSVLVSGKVLATGSPDEIVSNESVVASYLGDTVDTA